MKLSQAVLALIDRSPWESTSWGMEYSTLVFAIVPDQYEAFPHYLEVYSIMSDFIPPPVLGLRFWADEELRWSGEVVDIVKGEVMGLSCIVLQIQGYFT